MLFRTIPKEEEEALRARFAGNQADRASAAAFAGAPAASKQQSSASSKAQDNGKPPPAHVKCAYINCIIDQVRMKVSVQDMCPSG